MEKLKRIFDREYSDNIKDGCTHERAIFWAIDHIETCMVNVQGRFDYEGFKVTYAEYYTIYESEKASVEMELEKVRIGQLRKNAVVKYHPVDTVFNLKTSKGTYKLKVVEQSSCCGCFFSRIYGYAQAGYPLYECRYDYKTRNAYCSAEMREDNKKVIYKVCK